MRKGITFWPAAPVATRRSRLMRYGVALASVLIALASKAYIRQFLERESPFLLFFSAVVISAWYGGLGPGLVATLLATLLADYFFVAPTFMLSVPSSDAFIRLVIFVVEGVAVSVLSETRRRTIQQSTAQRDLLQVTLDSIADAVVTTDADGRVTFVNPVAERLLGWASAEAAGQPIERVLRMVEELSRVPIETPVAQVLRLGTTASLHRPALLVARDGREVPIGDSCAPIRDAAGRIVGVVLVFRDLSANRQAEENVRKSEQRYHDMAEAMPLIVWTTTPEGVATYFNQLWYAYTGTAAGESAGSEWSALTHPDDRERCQQRWLESVRTGQIYEIEYRLRRHDGMFRWFLDRALPVRDGRGDVALWIGTSTDIDDQKRVASKEHFLAEASRELNRSLDYEATLQAVATLSVPVLADWCVVDMLNSAGELERVATAYPQQTTVDVASEALRRYPGNVSNEVGVAHVLRTGRSRLITRVSRERLERMVTDPELLQISREVGVRSVMIVPLTIRGQTVGAITFVVGESNRDFDEADLALAENLAQRAAVAVDNTLLYRAAQNAILMRDQFLSIASHELKTPLTSLMGYTELLQRRLGADSGLPERDTRALRVIGDQARRLNRMVAGLLDLSRLQAGQLRIERGDVNLAALLSQIVEDTQLTLQNHTIELQIDAAEPRVEGDELRLEQVFQNLIQNAIKYSPSGGAVSVRVRQEAGQVFVDVADQGIGIPAESLPKLFNRFYRANNVSDMRISGMGLGLFVVQEIVSLHRGSVRVDSREGQGSTFSVCLPLHSGQVPDTTDGDGKRVLSNP